MARDAVATLMTTLVEYGTGDNWAVGLTLPNPPGEPPIPHGNFARWNILKYALSPVPWR